MSKIKLHTHFKKILADTFTPVGIYLKLRDKFPGSLLLESSDYHGNENSFSFICFDPIASICIDDGIISETVPGQQKVTSKLEGKAADRITAFAKQFELCGEIPSLIPAGLFGYCAYDSVKYFEQVKIKGRKRDEKRIPDLLYSVFRYVIAIDHFKDELYMVEHSVDTNSHLEELETLIRQRNVAEYHFSVKGQERSSLSDAQYIEMVKRGKEECKRGNIFQVVLSREFSQDFIGDDLNLYRALRSVNPSPYLFYFDQGNFKIFGSSPEAQLVVKKGEAQIHPIAGTFKRTGDDATDRELAEKLKEDKKERSEHVMLVDLARNDLSRNCSNVKVDVFAETQFYSHVIHLVSKVTGRIKENTNSMQVFADTFPAGTLSGAPKVKALQIIDACENDARGYYGGAIGFIGFNGDINQAIIIRSFLSKDNTLFYRAGAGVVIASEDENELQEVNNKLGALRRAMELASTKY